ncbi:dUTP diphosphatase [Candidatus Saccharibacteria bacterium]|nr:dUTP diphosphatase [Candidatus Saccharibacteria bacterium]
MKVEIVNKSNNPNPTYQTFGSSGMDIQAYLPEKSVVIYPGKTAKIPTGLYFSLPFGYEFQVRPRSGLAAKSSITVINTPGTVDDDYRGEVCVLLINHGNEAFYVQSGDRIAQLVLQQVPKAELIPVKDLDDTKRGSGGFGSTGIT